jgi:hypothetical protein
LTTLLSPTSGSACVEGFDLTGTACAASLIIYFGRMTVLAVKSMKHSCASRAL